jgi:hypothetical protein
MPAIERKATQSSDPHLLEPSMSNRLEGKWREADRMTFKKWAIGVMIFYGSLALLGAFLIAGQYFASGAKTAECAPSNSCQYDVAAPRRF